MDLHAIIEWLHTFATVNWIKEDYGVTILSAKYVESVDVSHMVNTFSSAIWLSLLILPLIVSIVLTVSDGINSNSYEERLTITVMTFVRRVWKSSFQMIQILLNQGIRLNNCLLLNLWSLIAVIFISCFSGLILSSLLIMNTKSINTFEELMSSDMRIICFNNTYSYYAINWANYSNDEMLSRLQHSKRIDFKVLNSQLNDEHSLNLLTQRKAVIITQQSLSESTIISNLHHNLTIADEKFYRSYSGYPINRRSLVKKRLCKM